MELMDILIIILSYLLGCFNTGYYYMRIFYKQDIRNVGTNVTGATNVSKVAGKKGFIITFLGDALKGALTVLLCRIFMLNDTITMISILMVIIGHIFPFQLKFRGGKGISTVTGAFLMYHPMLMVFLLVTCGVLLPFLRRNTVTSLFALLLLPLELFIADYPIKMIGFILIYALVIVYACRSNVKDFIDKRAYQGRAKNTGKRNTK